MIKYFKNLAILAFFNFAEYLKTQVSTNAVTWNIPAIAATDLDLAFNTYKPYYDAIKVKKNRTQQQVDDHGVQRVIFEDFIEKIANQHIIPNPLITEAQVTAMGFNRKSDPGTRTAIDTQPHLTLKAKSGSRMEVENRVESDQSRASLHQDSDGVEVKYIISLPATGGTPTTPGTPAGGTAAAVYINKFSKKAKFLIQLSETDAGKIITMQSRWVNLTDVAKNGPWSNPASTMITW